MTTSSDYVLHRYLDLHKKLYNRPPRELTQIDSEWVIVNGAKMRFSELENLTQHLQNEYRQTIDKRRNLASRLIKWLKG
jgi:hypothetical protein